MATKLTYTRWEGEPGKACAKCKRRACERREVVGVGAEYQCLCCGFLWSGKNGQMQDGSRWVLTARGWERDR